MIAGQGTVGLELLEDLPEVDVIVVGAGGGGLVSGIASAVKAVRPGCRVYAVEPVGSDGLRRAVEAGHPVPIAPVTMADGLGAASAGDWTLAIACPPGRRLRRRQRGDHPLEASHSPSNG